MEFIAMYWWVWLLAMVGCWGLALWRQASGVFGILGSGLDVVATSVETLSDKSKTREKQNEVMGRSFVQNMAIGRAKNFVLSMIAIMAMAWVFGSLFLLSLILNIIDYIKA